jgi:pimeloyl-ACP methyl ester carboxylesterase
VGSHAGLPSPTDELTRFAGSVAVDWSDAASVTEYLVDYYRVLAGDRRFDADALRELARRDIARAHDFSAAQNHEQLDGDGRSRAPLSAIAAPTLVIHGTADPMFPIAHGEALAAAIPGAVLVPLEGAGHGVDRADWGAIALAILEHTVR